MCVCMMFYFSINLLFKVLNSALRVLNSQSPALSLPKLCSLFSPESLVDRSGKDQLGLVNYGCEE